MKLDKRKYHVSSQAAGPFVLVRLRTMVLIVMLIGAGIALPLFAVWRQVYVRSSALACKGLTESLATKNREIQRLKIVSRGLSDVGRIEMVARTSLHLEYPQSKNIVIVSPRSVIKQRQSLFDNEFFAILRRSLLKDKG
jgi:cell division protein FtsL